MMNRIWIIIAVFAAFAPGLTHAQVETGAQSKEAYYPALKGKRVGIVANNASVVDGINIVDRLIADGINITEILSPEHGFRKFADAGEHVASAVDSATGIPVISLYSDKKKLSGKEISEADIIVFDIQDVGVRFYTYISTLTLIMEAAAEHHIPVVVLDRPNPNGFYIDGPVLEKNFSSFVGLHTVPVVYGMTIGEYAMMVNGEGWLPGRLKCDLTVVRMKSYTHRTEYNIPSRPSPNLPTMNAMHLYPSLCLFEGTIVSVGRGTDFPFEVFGHPDLPENGFSFTPKSIKGMSSNPPFENKICNGSDLRTYYRSHPADYGRINLSWLIETYHQLNSRHQFFNDYFNKLAGNSVLQEQIRQGMPEKKIRATWQPGIEKFKKIRKKYLIYE